MKKLLLLALAIVVAFVAPAFAEVQNVKVGGDITSYYEQTTNLNLTKTNTNASSDNFFMTTTRLYVSADLTDNVQTYVRIINERTWDSKFNTANDGSDASEEDAVQLDLAYVKLSEFLYSPLTMIIGRQEIKWGSGLVVGNGNPVPNNKLQLRDSFLSARKGFDAARAILNFEPWTIDSFASRIANGSNAFDPAVPSYDGRFENLYGLNVSYVWPSEWVTEGYYVYNTDKDTSVGSDSLFSKVSTVGLRTEGHVKPIDEKLYLEAELAYQFGKYDASRDIKSWAGILGTSYEFANQYKPVVGVKYDYRSGNKTADTGDYKGWNAKYNDYQIGNIINKVWTNGYKSLNSDVRGNGGNIHAITTTGSVVPMQDVELSLDWVWATSDQAIFVGNSKNIGNEFIGTVKYDYTEDVTMSLMGSVFDPKGAFRTTTEKEKAYEVIGSVAVEF